MSYRHRIFGYCGLLTLGFLSFSSAAVVQEKSAKELIVGTWTLSIADHGAPTAPRLLASARFRAAPPRSALTAAILCRSRPMHRPHWRRPIGGTRQ